MPYVHPPRLRNGDTVALVSPAGAIPKPEVADQCALALEALGFRVKVGENARKRLDYLGGSDEERAADLNAALRDPKTKAIFCTRGGYGSGRLARLLDCDAMRSQPKILAGFSDITALHAAFLVRSGVCTLHATTIAAGYVYDSSKITQQSHAVHLHHLTKAEPLGSIRDAMGWRDPWVLRKGQARGVLVGGNASVFAATVGTPEFPKCDGAILFLEDIGEEPYRLDRMINQLAMAGVLDAVRGVILGQFTDCKSDNPERGTANEMLERVLGGLRVPIIGNFPAGHVPHNAALPIGCEVEIDADAGDVKLVEAFAR